MKLRVWIGMLFFLLTACSEGHRSLEAGKTDEPEQGTQMVPIEDSLKAEEASIDCPGFEELFALLPNELSGEAISEQYFSCDATAPTAFSHFTSEDQSTFWTFSVTSRELDTPPARLRWDISNTDESQKAFLKKGLKAVIDAEALLFDNCVNYLQLRGLPNWQTTNRISVNQYDVCIGTDSQMIEDGGWIARAKSPQYLYTVKIAGEKATQFDSAHEVADYVEKLFRQFR